MNKTIITLISLVVALVLSSCVLNFDVDPDDVDMAVTMIRDSSCSNLSSYAITASGSYQKSFSSNFTSDEVEQHWVGVPDEDFDLKITLSNKVDGSINKYGYKSELGTSWGKAVAFRAVCDEGYQKPVLLLDVAKFVLVVNNIEECNWFSKIEFFEETGNDGTSAFLQSLGEESIENMRTVLQWHETLGENGVVHIYLTDAKNNVHKFRFPVMAVYGQRLDFNISCDASTLDVDMLMQTSDGTTYEPVPLGEEPDGDMDTDITDTDAATDGDEDGDIDNTTDGDVEDDTSVDGDLDGEQPEEDLETVETDVETEDTEQEAENDDDQVCGTVDPSYWGELEAEDLSFTSNPPGFGQVWSCEASDGDQELEDCTNPFSGNGAVVLNATDVNQQLILPVTIPESWIYRIGVIFAGGNTGFGRVSLFIDDSTEPLMFLSSGKTYLSLHMSSAEIAPYSASPIDFATVCLSKGEHQFKFVVVDSDTAGYKIGVDMISILSD